MTRLANHGWTVVRAATIDPSEVDVERHYAAIGRAALDWWLVAEQEDGFTPPGYPFTVFVSATEEHRDAIAAVYNATVKEGE